ncbi:MAG: hypothetical protein HKP14_06610 [Bacteroidia bacterium]|nr:hypothetical protein [Bacteroidia bacterium]
MNDQITKITLDEANDYYDVAQEELCRPEEDLVPFMICRSAYKSVGNYLAAFLFHEGIDVKNSMTLEFLLKTCREKNANFNELNLDPLFYGNAHSEEVVSADMETMHVYLDLAAKTKELVTEQLK